MGCFELKGRIAAYPRLLVLMVPEYMALRPGIYVELISASEAASLNHEIYILLSLTKMPQQLSLTLWTLLSPICFPNPHLYLHELVDDRQTGILQQWLAYCLVACQPDLFLPFLSESSTKISPLLFFYQNICLKIQ